MAATPSRRRSVLALNQNERVQLVRDLRQAVRECKERGLQVAAKWAGELLVSIPVDIRLSAAAVSSSARETSFKTSTPTTGRTADIERITRPRISLGDHVLSGNDSLDFVAPASTWKDPSDAEDELLEADTFDLAKTYFDSKELERAVKTLNGCRSKRSKFLRLYSTYLAADKKAQENLPHFLDSKEERLAITPHIYPILAELNDEDEPYLLYLKGILYSRLGHKDLALENYIRSVHGAPYNWSCWLNIASCIQLGEEFIQLKHHLPQGIMQSFFAINVMLDLHSATELMMTTIGELERLFPTSVHLKASRALVLYHMREFEEAEQAFDDVREIDPYRLEEIEIYSNMLYVMNRKAKLGKLAHEYGEIDKNRAEVCCLIGNYYSAREEHTKAIQYFKRSLQLNRDYLPAWTLMGHEFVELKNSHAAIEAYRRAIDVNPKDYRAWYGLGQTYELLDMHFYAVQYYNRATALRPYDCRMWSALATVYEHLKKLPEAIQSNNRALLGADTQQTINILAKLGQLYDNSGRYAEAANAHRRLILIGEREGHTTIDLAPSYVYVAQFELDLLHRDRTWWAADGDRREGADGAVGRSAQGEAAPAQTDEEREQALAYLSKVAMSNAPEKEIAEEDLRHLRQRRPRDQGGDGDDERRDRN